MDYVSGWFIVKGVGEIVYRRDRGISFRVKRSFGEMSILRQTGAHVRSIQKEARDRKTLGKSVVLWEKGVVLENFYGRV